MMQPTVIKTSKLLPFANQKTLYLSAIPRDDRQVLLQIPIAVLLTSSLLDPRGFLHRVL